MSLTDAQRKAITARGNVLVVAGAGTGKTRTLVEHCLPNRLWVDGSPKPLHQRSRRAMPTLQRSFPCRNDAEIRQF